LSDFNTCCGSCCVLLVVIVGCVFVASYFPEGNMAGVAAGFVLIFTPLATLISALAVEKRKKAELLRQEAERQRAKAEYEAILRRRGYEKFVDRYGREKWGTPEQVKEWSVIDLGLRDNFANYSPREFEKFVARLFTEMGYAAELCRFTGDYGADVIARRNNDVVLVQVKKYQRGHNVGARDVQRALGAMWKFKATKSVLVTTSDFTIQAEEQAKGAPIELWGSRTLERFVEEYFVKALGEKEGERRNDLDVYVEACAEQSDKEEKVHEAYEGEDGSAPRNEQARKARRAGLLGADRAGTW